MPLPSLIICPAHCLWLRDRRVWPAVGRPWKLKTLELLNGWNPQSYGGGCLEDEFLGWIILGSSRLTCSMEERPWDLEHFRFQPVNFSGVFFSKHIDSKERFLRPSKRSTLRSVYLGLNGVARMFIFYTSITIFWRDGVEVDRLIGFTYGEDAIENKIRMV